MKIEVELIAFGNGQIRTVEVPDSDMEEPRPLTEKLELVFTYGQNDFQPLGMPSVSVGDVVRFDGKRYRVEAMGYEEVK